MLEQSSNSPTARSIADEARAEAGRRYPAWIHRDLHHAGYWAFHAGAEWQASRKVEAAPSDTEQEALGEVLALVDDYDGCHQRIRDWEALPDCDCDLFFYNEDKTADTEGHMCIAGSECLFASWFEGDAAVYIGDDYDQMRDDCVPPLDRSGPVTLGWTGDEWPEWNWETTPEQPEGENCG